MFGYNTEQKDTRKEFLKVPTIKPLNQTAGLVLFGGIALIGLGIGATIGTYVFFGCVTLAGLIAIAESNKYIQYLVVKGNKVVDVILFGATIVATASLGITVAASLTVAGLGYTLVYAPYLRNRKIEQQKQEQDEQ